MTEFRVQCYEHNGIRWHEGYQAYEDMKWTLLMEQVDILDLEVVHKHKTEQNNKNIGYNGCTIRPNNGMWDLMGMEICEIGRPPFIGLHGSGETPDLSNSGYNYQFSQFKFNYEHINEKTPTHISNELSRALVDCARNNSDNSPLRLLDELVGYGYLRKENDEYRPTFLVQFKNKLGKWSEEQKIEYQKLYNPAIKLLDSLYLVCKDAVMQEVPVFLREDEHQINHAIAQIMFPRGSVFKQALDTGWLKYDKADQESAKHRMLGASLVIG